MATPQARIRVGSADVLVLGTIAGFGPDGDRVRQAFDAFLPDLVALGVPPEDIDSLGKLQGVHVDELGGLDDANEHLLQQVGAFGPVRIPSPDLEAAHERATAANVPLEALDLDDAGHAALFTSKVKFHHVVQSNIVKGRLLKRQLTGTDAYDVAAQWDATWNKPKGLRLVEAEREAHMARRLREAAAGRARVLAIVPSVRLAGILSAFGNVDTAAPGRSAR